MVNQTRRCRDDQVSWALPQLDLVCHAFATDNPRFNLVSPNRPLVTSQSCSPRSRVGDNKIARVGQGPTPSPVASVDANGTKKANVLPVPVEAVTVTVFPACHWFKGIQLHFRRFMKTVGGGLQNPVI